LQWNKIDGPKTSKTSKKKSVVILGKCLGIIYILYDRRTNRVFKDLRDFEDPQIYDVHDVTKRKNAPK